MTSSISGRRRCIASATVALLLLTGCASNASTQTVSALDTTIATGSTSTSPSSAAAALASPADVMAASVPVSIDIPSSVTRSKLISLGLRNDGTLEVPPGEPGAPAAWFNGSPTPGERGPAVIYGHVNATDGGLGVFADLRSLAKGDLIRITRQNGTIAVFKTDRGEQYSKTAFPTEKVYGNTEGAELRLITCDGYDAKTGEFDDNYVVYATLVS
ncbi:class F sortase [Pseudarthrobacter sp. NPDC055928]|uniref:class F sortase n=1 Tax=Pseudarthrobacter sp. NPDC055928 TaxID=3345661 RepID=UPI0035D854B1